MSGKSDRIKIQIKEIKVLKDIIYHSTSGVKQRNSVLGFIKSLILKKELNFENIELILSQFYNNKRVMEYISIANKMAINDIQENVKE